MLSALGVADATIVVEAASRDAQHGSVRLARGAARALALVRERLAATPDALVVAASRLVCGDDDAQAARDAARALTHEALSPTAALVRVLSEHPRAPEIAAADPRIAAVLARRRVER